MVKVARGAAADRGVTGQPGRSPVRGAGPLPNQPGGSPAPLSGKAKVALLLVVLGPEAAGPILQALKDDEIEMLTVEIANQRKIPPAAKEAVLGEFEQLMAAREFYTQGGIEYARRLLEHAVGPLKALDVLAKMGANLDAQPFAVARTCEAGQLVALLHVEQPQTIALVLAHLTPERAALVMQALGPEVQVEVARRLALLERASPEIMRGIEQILERKLAAMAGSNTTHVGGLEALVNVLGKVERATEKSILETMEVQEPNLAEEIKKRLFVFEDVVLIDDRGMQRVLHEVDPRDLAVALKGVTDDVRVKFLRNMSKRAASMLQDEMTYMGPVRIRDVDVAQQRIVTVIKNLDARGQIMISRPGDDDLIE